MKLYALRVVAALSIFAGCDDQGTGDDPITTPSPATDSAVGPVSVGTVAESDASKPDGGGSPGATSGAGGPAADGGGRGAVPFDAGTILARDAGTAETGVGVVADGGADASTADASTGSCVKGQTKGSEVVVIGDSFIAINHAITTQVQSKARGAGALGQADRYRDLAVSGTTLANEQIPGQYKRAVGAGPVKVVLMNGGGNDCLQRNDSAGALSAATSLLQGMAQNNTESVVYFFYPDPAGLLGGGSLKSCLDTLRPQIKSLCDGLSKPRCFFIDLRSSWRESYAMADGIHPTQEGGAAVGDVVWQTMQEHCIAQ